MSGGTTHPLTPFLTDRQQVPYLASDPRFQFNGLVVAVQVKSGFATSRRTEMVHIVDKAAAILHEGRLIYGARWLCGGKSFHAVLLASSDGWGSSCARCEDATSPVVYCCYAADGSLLYVGSSNRSLMRLGRHRRQSPWWPEVAEIKRQAYPSLGEARAAERQAIETERPKHNHVYHRVGIPAWMLQERAA